MKKVKGLVVEIRRKHVILLTPDGEFVKAVRPSEKVSLGSELRGRSRTAAKKSRVFYPALAAAAILFLVFLPLSADLPLPWSQGSAAGYVAVDLNPSLELTFNRSLEVIDYRSLNDEGASLIEGLPSRENIYEALKAIFDGCVDLGYLDPHKDDNFIMITVTRTKNVELSMEILEEWISEYVYSAEISGLIGLYQVEPELRQKASDSGVSANRQMLINALEYSGGAGVEQLDSSMEKSLQELYREYSADLTDLPGHVFETRVQERKRKGSQEETDENGNSVSGPCENPGFNKVKGPKTDQNNGAGGSGHVEKQVESEPPAPEVRGNKGVEKPVEPEPTTPKNPEDFLSEVPLGSAAGGTVSEKPAMNVPENPDRDTGSGENTPGKSEPGNYRSQNHNQRRVNLPV